MATQLQKLDALISAATAAREAARQELLFASVEGVRLVHAMFDLTEVSELYILRDDVAHEVGLFDGVPAQPEAREQPIARNIARHIATGRAALVRRAA